MARLFAWIFLLLTTCSAFAQAEVNEHASPLTVIIFIVVFVGSCVGYFAYIWWGKNKKK